MKQELIDHFSEMLLKQYGIKPKQQSCMYKTLYPSGYDQVPFPPRFKVPDFTKFSGQDETSTMEHITQFIMQCGEAGNVDALRYIYSLHLCQGQHSHGSHHCRLIPSSSGLIWNISSIITSSLASMRFREVRNKCYSLNLGDK
jgi:hypothetical protein